MLLAFGALLLCGALLACGDDPDYGDRCKRTGLLVSPDPPDAIQLTKDSPPLRFKTPPQARKQCPHDFEIRFGWDQEGMDSTEQPPLEIICGSPLRRVPSMNFSQGDGSWIARAHHSFEDDVSSNPIYLYCELSYDRDMYSFDAPIWIKLLIQYRGDPEDGSDQQVDSMSTF
jgi:hypothetical protein